MDSTNREILKEKSEKNVQIIAYKAVSTDQWTAVIGRFSINTQMTEYWPLPLSFADSPVRYDGVCYQKLYINKYLYMLKLSDGWEWSHERGFYDPKKLATNLPGTRYYKVENGKTEDVTDLLGEVIKSAKELAAIAIASKVVIDSFKEPGK